MLNYLRAGLNAGAEMGPEIWSPRDLSTSTAPPLGSAIAGNFLVLDSSASAAERNKIFPGSEKFWRPEKGSFLEIAFGKNEGTFSGSHRIEVQRESDVSEKEPGESVVVVTWSQVRGNPTEDGNLMTSWINGFHKVYAMSLYANGVSEILKR